MPEGDSLRRAARRLQVLVGERVEALSPHPQGQLTGVAARVDGRVLEAAEAAGKNLLLRFEGGLVVRSHLRMRGRWTVVPRDRPAAGRPWLVLRGERWEARQWNGPVLELGDRATGRLGPDVLDDEPDLDGAVARLRRLGPATPLGEALQVQRAVAGIGNMWMAEALWAARLSPWLRLGEAGDDDLRRAVGEAARLMAAALRDGRQPRAVYRRAGRPCPRCGARLRSRGQGDANRTAYWCPGCQRGGPPWASAGGDSAHAS